MLQLSKLSSNESADAMETGSGRDFSFVEHYEGWPEFFLEVMKVIEEFGCTPLSPNFSVVYLVV